jgi:hypothetical protein
VGLWGSVFRGFVGSAFSGFVGVRVSWVCGGPCFVGLWGPRS